MKRTVCSLLFLISCICYSQSIYISGIDTLVVLSPKDVITLNCVFSDLRYYKEDCRVSDSIISSQSRIIAYKDSILSYREDQVNSYRSLLESEMRISKREKVKAGIFGGLGGLVLGFITGLLVR